MVSTLLLLVHLGIGSPIPASPTGDWTLNWAENAKLPRPIRQFELPRPDGSTLTAFLGVFGADAAARKPLVILCDGSGAQSLFAAVGDKVGMSGLLGLFGKSLAHDFHVVALEKRGVKFLDGVRPGSAEGASEEYQRHATLEDRVADVKLVIDALLKQTPVDPARVVVIGHSEGSDVAAAASAAEPRVTHAACLAGAGITQFFDLVILQRRAMLKEGLPEQVIANQIEQLHAEFSKILAAPDAIDQFFMGHAYKRWASFAKTPPVESLRKSRCKVFLAHGSADESVPVESFEALVAELVRSGRKDMTVRRYPGRDHGFMEKGADRSKPAMQEVLADIREWLGVTTSQPTNAAR